MKPKERLLTAYRHGQPDRVPVAPDLSMMIPARLTGQPFWSVFLYGDPPLGEAYLETVRRFDLDGLYWYDDLEEVLPCDRPRWQHEIAAGDDQHTRRSWVTTPLGTLTMQELFPREEPPWLLEKPIKEPERDFPLLRQVLGETGWCWRPRLPHYERVGDLCLYELAIQTPIDWWFSVRDGGWSNVLFDLTDRPDYMCHKVFGWYYRYALAKLEAMLQARPDAIWLGGSASSLSVSSPAFFRTYDLPMIKAVTRRCREAGIPSHLHICGRSGRLVEMIYAETDLDVMEPLEPPPGGDVDLAEAKRRWGDKLCLKGNLNTFELMLRGTPAEVEAAARRCIEVAAPGGGFVLSTGDQCGRDTPEENIERLIEVAKRAGLYT